ncbi:MAG: preprotein translocase subunit SecE [Parcubacteria group bacterium CG11_big_fil_rev_8_21_14_0_20_39_14]|nr:MAG: preprotein translocase subunit SecE [Parcubacteria group bacterium CG11_big_fil_rev_8_21_14_0_20_39_14]
MFTKLIIFLKEVKVELKKVNWPTRQETIKYSLMVVGASAVIAFFLGGLDFLFTIIINRFIF